MCVGVEGRVVELDGDTPVAAPTGTVETADGQRRVCFAFLPDVVVGDVVLVHSGFAINRLDDGGGDR
ncbi:HypC/HybG/HupF family hydrogenase formation chaperone [Kribbella sp. HUAS MG21]|uniref:HypC/HybG/HupF family hydrogenase formation chaperone n=1 Tax=Kribbella sp. HUAS MG21 TaxID=3160966 RepID=A0AAU7TQB9_9ACTN